MRTHRLTVLLIEDNAEIRESAAEVLELADFEVHTADNGKTGVALALQLLPDIVLCDIMMPGLDGYGVLHLLGKDPNTSGIPFIFLTAKAERADIRKGMELGADDYLIKPFDDAELLSAIDSRLRKHAAIHKGGSEGLGLLVDEARAAKLLTKLSDGSRVRLYKKKQSVYLELDEPHYCYLVKTGRVKTVKTAPDGRSVVTGMFGPGDFFGYEAVIPGSPYTDSAEALEESELHLLPREAFNALLYRNPAISQKFIALLSGNIRGKQEKLLQLAYHSVRKRVADALAEVAMKFAAPASDEAEVRISRDDLAAMAGTAGETVSRMLADFKEEGLLDKSGSTIRIYSLQRLKSVKQ